MPAIRTEDVLARIGGDEFVVLVEAEDRAGVDVVARRIHGALSHTVAVDGRDFVMGASVGVAHFPDDARDGPTLLQCADLAMYRVKRSGGGDVGYYSAQLHHAAAERLALATQLRRAVDGTQFVLHWQGRSAAHTGEITGAEALIRWNHPTRGLILPGEFVPLAEELGVIVPIGYWVLQAACGEAAAWVRQGALRRVAVNLSPRQFGDPQLLQHVTNVLQRTGLNPALLEVELTETMVMRDVARAADTMRQLRALGVRIALDDFGTGHSSLAWLRRFPIDILKVDRSFVRDLPQVKEAVAITQAVIGLAKCLGHRVVAEGVETIAQAELLTELGCDELQGFLVMRPGDAAELNAVALSRAPQGTASMLRGTLAATI